MNCRQWKVWFFLSEGYNVSLILVWDKTELIPEISKALGRTGDHNVRRYSVVKLLCVMSFFVTICATTSILQVATEKQGSPAGFGLGEWVWPSPGDEIPFWMNKFPATNVSPEVSADIEKDSNLLHIIHITAEMAPIAKVGGLGDVFFKGQYFYGGSYNELEAYVFFSRACLEWMQVTGVHPDIIHVHEWQTGALPLLYWDMYHLLSLTKPRVVLTIHNMEHYEECRKEQLSNCGLDGSIYGTEDKLHSPIALVKLQYTLVNS
ncbi:hypothetical protein Pint_13896 [Pistacia integerrima]|uniref:Uncharacterized protein n=1 Tax=Pistacia integerrima TaxID=434235 RepID=A0ACC0Y412_9ROSI|nr:hypothetical protein Pint_13896 [Pistacia integerrima]